MLARRWPISNAWNDVLAAQWNAAQSLIRMAVAPKGASVSQHLLLEINRDVRAAHGIGTGNAASVGS